MTPSSERWINNMLANNGLGPISRDEDFWAQLWAHALNAAEHGTEPRHVSLQHKMARYTVVRAVETLYYGWPMTELPINCAMGYVKILEAIEAK